MVSVIIPVYNVAAYLEECVQSVLNQTYTNLEIILVDDGSTDDSGAMCDRFAATDPRVRVIHRENGGLSAARNTGLTNANGQFLYFLDSDDWIDPDTVEQLRTQLLETDSDFVIFNAVCFEDGGKPFSPNPYKRHATYKTCTAGEMARRQFVFDEYKPCVPLSFYKSDFIRQNDLSFKDGVLGEDELFSFYAYCTDGRVTYTADMFYHRRMRAGSIMTSTDKNAPKCDSYHAMYCEMLAVWESSDAEKRKTVGEFIVRLVKSYMRMYGLLPAEEQATRAESYQNVRAQIKAHKGFGDRTLLVRLHNTTLGIALSGVRKNIRKIIWKLR